MTLGNALRSDRSINLDALRLFLAASVIISHAWPLAHGPGTPEPLESLTGHSLGGWAVAIFFFLSGLLVTASAERRSTTDFWAARIRRIFPGLAVALVLTFALAVASGSNAGADRAASWFVRAFTLVSIEHRLPGAFADNPYPEVVNGPLWSLFHEVMAYVICVAFVRSGSARRPAGVLAFLALAIVAALASEDLPRRAATFAPLFAAFALGMAAHIFRDRIPLIYPVAFLLFPVAALAPWPVAISALSYSMITLTLRSPTLRLDADVSYGLYIYGWPVAQFILHLNPGVGPIALGLLSLAATIPLALASWCFVERPGLFLWRAEA